MKEAGTNTNAYIDYSEFVKCLAELIGKKDGKLDTRVKKLALQRF